MAYSSATYQSSGSQSTFTFPFDYINKSFVKATLDGVAFSYGVDYEITGKEITFKVPPSGILKIYRETPTDRLVEWNEGSVLLSSDMTLSQVQQLHIIEEQQAWSKEKSIVLNDDNVWEGRFSRLGNVADPVNDQDVVTKKYMETVQGGFVQVNTALKDKATKQANIATTKAGEASASAARAEQYASYAGIRFIVVSTRERGDDEPTYGLT